MNAPAAPLVARLRAEIADLRQQLAAAQRETEVAQAWAINNAKDAGANR